MAKGKKGKTAKQAKEGEDVAEAVPPTATTTRRLQPCSEEIRVSFNFIQRFIREVEKDAPGWPKQGTTIPHHDVARAQRLCAGLLEQNEWLVVKPEAEAFHPQHTALDELARAKKEYTDAVLKAGEVVAFRKSWAPFHATSSWSMNSWEEVKKAILKGPEPVIQTFGYLKLMARAAKREGVESDDVDELLMDPKRFEIDLIKFIERLTPTSTVTTESMPVCVLKVPFGEGNLETHFFKEGEPLQKSLVDKVALMTKVEWRNEAKALRHRFLNHIEVIERFAGQVHKYVPELPARIEVGELFGRIQEGIEVLSKKRDILAVENKDLHLAIAKKSYDKHKTEFFCAAAMQCFPHLQKKYESISSNDIDGIFNLILGGIAEMKSARDNATNMNVPLRDQITEMKKKLAAEAKALKFSQEGRDQDRAKHMHELTKKECDVFNLLHQAKKAAADFDQYKKKQQKKIEQLTAELSATKSALTLKTTELETTAFDADRTMTELKQLRKQSKEFETGWVEWETELSNLRERLEEAQSSLLSSRKNQQVEQDRIRKAVQGATHARDERIKSLVKALQDLRKEQSLSEQARKSDEKNIREIYQDKHYLKDKNQELEEKLSNVAAVQEALELELAGGRTKVKLLEDKLSPTRANS